MLGVPREQSQLHRRRKGLHIGTSAIIMVIFGHIFMFAGALNATMTAGALYSVCSVCYAVPSVFCVSCRCWIADGLHWVYADRLLV